MTRRPLLLDLRREGASPGASAPRCEVSRFDGAEYDADEFAWGEALRSEPGMSNRPMAPVAMAWSVDPTSKTFDEVAASVRRRLHDCRVVGASCLSIRLAMAGIATGGPFLFHQEKLNAVFSLWRRLRFEAEEQGVRLGIEVVRGGVLLSPTEARELIDACASAAIGVCLDAATIVDGPDLTDWIVTLGPRVTCVRLADSFEPARAAELGRAMAASAYQGPVVVGYGGMGAGALAADISPT